MPDHPQGVAILGSTGSIGRQAIDVLVRHPDRFRVVSLGANRSVDELRAQADRLRPAAIAVTDTAAARAFEAPPGIATISGPGALEEIAVRDDVDIVVVGTAGIVSLGPVLAALRAGKVVATANKETLVAGGHLVMAEARRLSDAAAVVDPGGPSASPLAWLRPLDSEHSAIWQCLAGERHDTIRRLILTASGGPFIDGPLDLTSVTPADALRHPTWSMGAKVTIDSATLANKGLEVIEACWLYDVPDERIDVVIHRQSIVHSAVVFADGSMKAQLGTPDMRIPIGYALTYPDRVPVGADAVDLAAAGRLDLAAPDAERFPALRIAREAGRIGSRASTALIAADDVAVARFLTGSLAFVDIPRLLEAAVARFGGGPDQRPSLPELVALDEEIRGVFATGPISA
ncbi:MAG TPA: 1-deoxy-D-xylulose-5-phosphate reductoisomerase [Candidatus Limnocylindrales bacterium]|nr:1-deoxy-D-xylulose-5-phosphate reductoisomerase [Candidatus Limnocylindrales bacterium]